MSDVDDWGKLYVHKLSRELIMPYCNDVYDSNSIFSLSLFLKKKIVRKKILSDISFGIENLYEEGDLEEGESAEKLEHYDEEPDEVYIPDPVRAINRFITMMQLVIEFVIFSCFLKYILSFFMKLLSLLG